MGGVWYDYAYSSKQGDASDSCVKVTVSQGENQTIILAQTEIG